MKEQKKNNLLDPKEVFISYAWGEESEIMVIALEMACQAKQIKTFKTLRDKEEVGYKGQILEFMQRLGQGKAIVIIVNEKYLKSKNCMFELLEIYKNGEFYERIFPIVLEDSKIDDAFTRIDYINHWQEKEDKLNEKINTIKSKANIQGIAKELSLYSDIRNKWDELIDVISKMNSLSPKKHQESHFAEIIEAIEERLHESEPTQKKSNLEPTIHHNLKNSGVAQFVGRENVLIQIHDKLQQAQRVAVSTLSGMGGIGKTELALQYAWQEFKKGTYQGGICWVNSKSNDLGSDIISFFDVKIKLGKPQGNSPTEQVQYCWDNWISGDVLIIFDDVRDYSQIIDYLPPLELKKFKIIITTRLKFLSDIIENIHLEELSENASLDLLRSYLDNDRINSQIEESKLLCQDLGYLPLALELVARLLRRRTWTIKHVRDELRKRGLGEESLLSRSHPEMTAKQGVKAAFDLSWDELKDEPKVQKLALYLSLFAIAPITISWINDLFPNEDLYDIEQWLIDNLVNLSLVKEAGNNEYGLHSLIHLYLREKLNKSKFAKTAKEDYCKLMISKFQKLPHILSPQKIKEVKPWVPHIKEVIQSHYDYILEDSNDDIPSNWNLPIKIINSFYVSQGFYPEAIECFENYLDITKNKFGEDDIHLMVISNDFALILKDSRKYYQAMKLLEQALSVAKKCLGGNHYETLMITNAMADTYRQIGEYRKAEQMLTALLPKVLPQLIFQEGAEQFYISELTLCVPNNLGLVYKAMARYWEAEKSFKFVVDFFRKSNKNNIYFAQAANNLGGLYIDMERYQEAEFYCKNALRIHKSICDPKNLNYRRNLNELANLFILQDKLDEAEEVLVELFEIQLNLDYLENDSLEYLRLIASKYFDQGRYEAAKRISIKINQLYQKFELAKSLDYCESLNLLAKSCVHLEDFEKAVELITQAIIINKNLYPQLDNLTAVESYSNLALALWNLASKLFHQNKQDQCSIKLLQAESFAKLSLRICQDIFEKDQQQKNKYLMSSIHNNLGLILEDLQKYSEAEESYRISLELRREELGNENYLVGQSLLNLAACYDWQKKNDNQVEEMLLECRAIWEKLLDSNHPEIVHCYAHLAKYYARIKQFDKAIKFYKKTISNCRTRQDDSVSFYQAKLDECIREKL